MPNSEGAGLAKAEGSEDWARAGRVAGPIAPPVRQLTRATAAARCAGGAIRRGKGRRTGNLTADGGRVESYAGVPQPQRWGGPSCGRPGRLDKLPLLSCRNWRVAGTGAGPVGTDRVLSGSGIVIETGSCSGPASKPALFRHQPLRPDDLRGPQAGRLMRIASTKATTVPGRQAPRIKRVVVTPRSGSP